MKTNDIIEQLRIARCTAHEMVDESYHCAKKMHGFIGTQHNLMDLSSSQHLISCYEESQRVLSEMKDHIRRLEEIQKTIDRVLEEYECAMPLVLSMDTFE